MACNTYDDWDDFNLFQVPGNSEIMFEILVLVGTFQTIKANIIWNWNFNDFAHFSQVTPLDLQNKIVGM